MVKTPAGEYRDIDHFLEENAGCINIHDELPKEDQLSMYWIGCLIIFL